MIAGDALEKIRIMKRLLGFLIVYINFVRIVLEYNFKKKFKIKTSE